MAIVAANQGDNDDLGFFALEIVDGGETDRIDELLLLERGLAVGVHSLGEAISGQDVLVLVTKNDDKVAGQSGAKLLQLSCIGSEDRDVGALVCSLSDEMPDQGHHHAHFPRIAVRFQALVFASHVLSMTVGEPENTVPHSYHIRQLIHSNVVLQTRIHGLPDELRDLGPHSSLDVELGDREWRQSGLTHGEALELASVKLIGCAVGHLHA